MKEEKGVIFCSRQSLQKLFAYQCIHQIVKIEMEQEELNKEIERIDKKIIRKGIITFVILFPITVILFIGLMAIVVWTIFEVVMFFLLEFMLLCIFGLAFFVVQIIRLISFLVEPDQDELEYLREQEKLLQQKYEVEKEKYFAYLSEKGQNDIGG